MSTEWTPDLTLNHEDLDADHVDLFRKLGAAAAALGGARDLADEALEAFADAFLAHVAHEDALMAESGYPEREGHRAAHDFFLSSLARLRTSLPSRPPSADEAAWLTVRAPEWLRFHIRVNDAPLVAWLARRRERPGAAEAATRRLS